MVLFPLLLLALAVKRCRNPKAWASAIGAFLVMQLIRFLAIGTVLPAGTGRTQGAETFSIGQAIVYAANQIVYIFGWNLGPGAIKRLPLVRYPLLGEGAGDPGRRHGSSSGPGLSSAYCAGEGKGKTHGIFHKCGPFCILYRGVHRGIQRHHPVEMRWIYVSYTAALLFMAYMYGVLTEGVSPEFYLKRFWPWGALIAGYVLFMFPAELFTGAVSPLCTCGRNRAGTILWPR